MLPRIVFRVDASIEIGSGHVMRCITLATALRAKDRVCQFICREHPGNLIKFIRDQGFDVFALSMSDGQMDAEEIDSHILHYAAWLGAGWRSDANQTRQYLTDHVADWLVVDHYALDYRWESAIRPHVKQIMVIDDLADRRHDCELLLDQTYGRSVKDYQPYVPAVCRLLCGTKYALLRPEFANRRPDSLKRRARPALRELLISMGGVDKDNVTCQILRALNTCTLPKDCRITVVLGETAPWLDDVMNISQGMKWPTRVLVGVANMAQLMTDSDLAIGAAGATSWERCCLGVPSIVFLLAENQRYIMSQLVQKGAASALTPPGEGAATMFCNLIAQFSDPENLARMSAAAASVVDGMGTQRLVDHLYAW